MKTLFYNAKLLQVGEKVNILENSSVVVTDKIITYVGNNPPKDNYDKLIDVKGNVLMPGFVNTHAHTPMTLLRGVKDDASLSDWLYDAILPYEAKLTEEDVYWGEMLGIAEYVRSGITAVEENYFNFEGMTKALAKSGFRARIGIGPKVINSEKYNCYKDIKKQYKIIKKNTDESLISVVCFAHAIYSVTEEYFDDILKFANENNLNLSIHLAETLKEVGDCTQKNNGLTPPAYLEKLGYLDRPCLCAHSVHLDKDDLQILADYDASVSTCPSSNIKLASGIAPIFAMQNKGINISIGTDGTASNNNLDMFKEMFLVATLSKVSINDPSVVKAEEVLNMATINGAKALFINSGEIAVGKNADIILINTNQPHMKPDTNLISNLVYSAKGSDVYFTMIGGKIMYEDGNYYLGEDISTIYNKVNQIRQRLEK